MKKLFVQTIVACTLVCTLLLNGCGEVKTQENDNADESVTESVKDDESEKEADDKNESLIDVNDPDAVKKLYHDVYAANTPESILSNHESYSTTWSMPASKTAYDELHYNDKESTYTEWSNGICEYHKDRYIYSAYYTPEACDARFGFDINDDCSLKYSTVLAPVEEDAYDLSMEIVDKVYKEDGLLYIESHLTEDGVKAWMKDMMGTNASGEKLYIELIADADTYEIKSLCYTGKKDREIETMFIGTASYDVNRPGGANALCAFFEQEKENMMTCTLIADKGTDREETFSVTLPQNTEVIYYYDKTAVYFNDPEYETISHWNRMDDWTLYVVRDPDKKMYDHFQDVLNKALIDIIRE
ncbi:MAG: hypothetical protein J5525_06220 [Lachnospiraceae bacterium]|nr:hypothetical protein [Lachnospiraceae bacterium]